MGHNPGMAKLLGIDVGTSGAKALLVDETGRVQKQASAEYPLSTPRPQWAEHDPELWWTSILSLLREIGEPNPDAIGLTGQMHGSVFLDENLQVVRPAILWCDQRTSAECEEIDRRVGAARVREITCNPPLTGFQAPKILWLRNHEPESFARVRHVLLPKDYLRLRLSGVLASEVSDASGTGVFDVPNRAWSAEMLEKLELPRSLFPDVAESDIVTSRASGVEGLSDGLPIVGGGGDQAAGAVGTGAVTPGIVSVSLGTSGVVFAAVERPEPDPFGTAQVFCHANRGWHAMGVMVSCGGALRWYRDVFGAGANYEQLAAEAREAPPGCEGLTFLPYLSGDRTPHNDPLARAAFAGATLSHHRRHFSRAVFEAMSFGMLDCMTRLRSMGAASREVRVTGGGAKSEFWVQMLADLFEAPCTLLECDEGPAYGAAILAGVGIGLWPEVRTACDRTIREVKVLEPRPNVLSEAYRRYRSLYHALREWNHKIE